MHHIRSQNDYQKHYLLPLRSSPRPMQPQERLIRVRRHVRATQWGRRPRTDREEADELERAVDRRRWVYQNDLYAKVRISTGALFSTMTSYDDNSSTLHPIHIRATGHSPHLLNLGHRKTSSAEQQYSFAGSCVCG